MKSAPSLLLRSAFSDAVCLRDPANNIKLAKARSNGRIDAACASVLAVAEEGARITGRVADLALAHNLASMFGTKQFVLAGGLISYGPDRNDLWRRGAIILDKVLKGIKPADLPVEQPTKFELVINLKTAKAISINFAEAFLARADEVIE